MVDAAQLAPQAVPQTAPSSNGDPTPHQLQHYDDPALVGFHKIAAERRSRVDVPPVVVPFGSSTIRIHASMPAGFAFDGVAAEVDPFAAKRMLRDTIIAEDQARFDDIMKLPPDNPEGVDGKFLIGFMEALAKFYSAVPLGG